MPRINKIIFKSIGHTSGRLDPLTLDFQGEHSVIWLRNGGGKSSILALIFAVLEPNRRFFMTKREDDRVIEGYVLHGDLAIVCIEWIIDEQSDSMRLATGVAMEWASGKLERLFFGFQYDTSDPSGEGEITIDTLPTQDNGRHLTMHGFREALKQAKTVNSRLKMTYTDNLTTWQRYLNDNHIDPELYKRQVDKMNRQEGQADSFIEFQTNEDFVNFFLDLVHENESAEEAYNTFEKYGDKIHQRPSMDAELALIEEIRPKMSTLHEKVIQKVMIKVNLEECNTKLAFLNLKTIKIREQTEKLEQELNIKLSTKEKELITSQHEKDLAEYKHTISTERKNEDVLRKLGKDSRLIEDEKAWFLKESNILDCLPILLDREALQTRLETLEKKFEKQKQPILSELEGIAFEVKTLLLSDALEKEKLLGQLNKKIQEIESEHTKNENDKIRHQTLVKERRNESERCAKLVTECKEEYLNLISKGILNKSEDPHTTFQSLEKEVATSQENILKIDQVLDAEHDEIETLQKQIEIARDAIREQNLQISTLKDSQANCLETWNKIVKTLAFKDNILFGMDAPSIDYSLLSNVHKWKLELKREEYVANEAHLRYSLQESSRILEYFNTNGCFPADESVGLVCKSLRSKGLNAHIGWDYIRTNFKKERINDFVKSIPHVLDGVLVLDASGDQLSRIVDELNQTTIEVSRPVIVTLIDYLTNEQKFQSAICVVNKGSEWRYDPSSIINHVTALENEVHVLNTDLNSISLKVRDLDNCLNLWSTFISRWQEPEYKKISSTLEELEAKCKQLTNLDGDLKLKIELQKRNKQQLRAKRDQAKKAENTLNQKLHIVDNYISRVYDPATAAAQRIKAIEKDLAEYNSEIEVLIENIAQLDVKLVDLNTRKENYTFIIRSRREEVTKLKYAPDSPPRNVSSMPLTSLSNAQEKYNVLVKKYEGYLKESDLGREIYLCNDQIKEFSSRLARILAAGEISEEELSNYHLKNIQLTLDEITTCKRQVLLNLGDNIKRGDEIRAEIKGINHALQVIKKKREKLESPALIAELRGYDVPTSEIPKEIKILEDEVESLIKQISSCEETIRNLKTQIGESNREIERFRGLERSLKEWLSAVSFDAHNIQKIAWDVKAEDLGTECDSQHTMRINLQRDEDDVIKDIATRIDDIQAIARNPRYSSAGSTFLDFFRHLAVESQTATQTLVAQLKNRADQISRDLADIDKYLDIVLCAFLAEVKTVLSELRALNSVKIIAPRSSTLNGIPFVKLQLPTRSDDQLRDAIKNYLMAFIQDTAPREPIKSGIVFLKALMLQITSSHDFKVQFLKPPQMNLVHYGNVVEYRAYSRGEKITVAILFYCMLVHYRLRNKIREISGRRTQVLILDNTLGQCSDTEFVTLQVEMATHLGVQLIYTTGIADENAIAPFPVKIPLRRERLDQRGNIYIEKDEKGIPAKLVGAAVIRKNDMTKKGS